MRQLHVSVREAKIIERAIKFQTRVKYLVGHGIPVPTLWRVILSPAWDGSHNKRTSFLRHEFLNLFSIVRFYYYNKLSGVVSLLFYPRLRRATRRLIDKFISTLMGGPASYTNDHLERVHDHLGITEPAFVEAMELLRETLEDHDFEDEDIDQVMDEMLKRKNFVVARS